MKKKISVLLIILLSHITYSVKTYAEGKPMILPCLGLKLRSLIPMASSTHLKLILMSLLTM
jgi:hypothetical protein